MQKKYHLDFAQTSKLALDQTNPKPSSGSDFFRSGIQLVVMFHMNFSKDSKKSEAHFPKIDENN